MTLPRYTFNDAHLFLDRENGEFIHRLELIKCIKELVKQDVDDISSDGTAQTALRHLLKDLGT